MGSYGGNPSLSCTWPCSLAVVSVDAIRDDIHFFQVGVICLAGNKTYQTLVFFVKTCQFWHKDVFVKRVIFLISPIFAGKGKIPYGLY